MGWPWRGRRANGRRLKIIFASGYSDRSILAEWPGKLDLMAKPYSLESLASRIAASLAAATAGA